MHIRSMLRRDVRPAAKLLAAQYRRWHKLDPRLSCPVDVEEAAFLLLDFEWDDLDSRAFVAEDDKGLAGYLRATQRRHEADDPQRIWLPDHYALTEVLYGFAARADLDFATVFTTLFGGAQGKFPPGEPWVLGLVPVAARLEPALKRIDFYKSSIFGYKAASTQADYPTPPGVTIRPAQRSDLPRLVELLAALHRYHQELDPQLDRPMSGAEMQMRGWLAYIFKQIEDWALIVADTTEAGVVGFALAAPDGELAGPRSITRFPDGAAALVHEFYIDDAWRRRGLGRALFAATERAALALGKGDEYMAPINGLWLIYRATNPTSTRFWPAVGFQPMYEMWRLGGWK